MTFSLNRKSNQLCPRDENQLDLRQMIHFLFFSVDYYAVVLAVSGSTRRSANVIVDSVGGHHVAVRKVVPEGSQVSLQCRVPVNSQLSRMMDSLIEPSLISNPVIWLRFDMKGNKCRTFINSMSK